MRDKGRETSGRQPADSDKQVPDSRKGYGYHELLVWQKGIRLAKGIYEITRQFPTEEKFGLISQMRRAAVSVPSNIAEGQARHTTKEFIQFVSHAEGSLAELDTQLRIAIELGYCAKSESAQLTELIEEMKRMLNGLRRNLAAKARLTASLSLVS